MKQRALPLLICSSQGGDWSDGEGWVSGVGLYCVVLNATHLLAIWPHHSPPRSYSFFFPTNFPFFSFLCFFFFLVSSSSPMALILSIPLSFYWFTTFLLHFRFPIPFNFPSPSAPFQSPLQNLLLLVGGGGALKFKVRSHFFHYLALSFHFWVY